MVAHEGVHDGSVDGLVREAVDLVWVRAQVVFFRITHGTLEVCSGPIRQQQLCDVHVAELTGEVEGQTTDARVDVTPLLDEQLHDGHVVVDDGALEQREAVPVDHSEHIPHLATHDSCGNNCQHSFYNFFNAIVPSIFIILIFYI